MTTGVTLSLSSFIYFVGDLTHLPDSSGLPITRLAYQKAPANRPKADVFRAFSITRSPDHPITRSSLGEEDPLEINPK
jgi:hypothetical protein